MPYMMPLPTILRDARRFLKEKIGDATMLEKPFYEVHRQRELKPGYEAMLVFYSSSGKAVSKEEATEEIIEIVKVNNDGRSKGDYERAIAKLLELYTVNNLHYYTFRDEAERALEEMATDSDLQYQIGLKVYESGYHYFGTKMLVKSGCKEAIEVLKEKLCYDTGRGLDHHDDLVAIAASEALNEMVGTDSDLQLQVGLAGRNSTWPVIKIWSAQMLAKSGRNEAIKPLEDMFEKAEDELKYLEDRSKKDTQNPTHWDRTLKPHRELLDTVRKALQELRAT